MSSCPDPLQTVMPKTGLRMATEPCKKRNTSETSATKVIGTGTSRVLSSLIFLSTSRGFHRYAIRLTLASFRSTVALRQLWISNFLQLLAAKNTQSVIHNPGPRFDRRLLLRHIFLSSSCLTGSSFLLSTNKILYM